VRAIRSLLRAPRQLAQLTQETIKGSLSFAQLARPTVATSLSGRSVRTDGGPGRAPRWPTSRRSGRRWAGRFNDVILATIAGGFRELLLARGEPVTGTVVRSLVAGLGAPSR